ncbi:IS66 family insertion sequence element accessory protein TnpB [Ensifer aridi]
MGGDPFSGTVYVFRAKRTDRIKLIFWDGTGMCLVANDRRSYYTSFPAS